MLSLLLLLVQDPTGSHFSPSQAQREAVWARNEGGLPYWPSWANLTAAKTDTAAHAHAVERELERSVTQPEEDGWTRDAALADAQAIVASAVQQPDFALQQVTELNEDGRAACRHAMIIKERLVATRSRQAAALMQIDDLPIERRSGLEALRRTLGNSQDLNDAILWADFAESRACPH